MSHALKNRSISLWLLVLIVGVVIGALLIGPVSAADAPPGGLSVAEQNVDENGNIKVHEQGVANVNVTNGSLDVDGVVDAQQSGSWEVGIVGTPSVNVENFPVESQSQSVGGYLELRVPDDAATTSIPENVLVTDFVAQFRGAQTDDCRISIVQNGVALWVDEHTSGSFELHMTTGVRGPLEITLSATNSQVPGCDARIFWTGTEASNP